MQSSSEDGEEDVLGFRVLDIAKNGISFLAKKREKDYFENEKKFPEFNLMFDGTTFKLKNGSLIYQVDYVSNEAGDNQLYKIGIKFRDNEKLNVKLDVALKESNSMNVFKRDFEEFLDE